MECIWQSSSLQFNIIYVKHIPSVLVQLGEISTTGKLFKKKRPMMSHWLGNRIWAENREEKIKVLLRSRATAEQPWGYLFQRIQCLVFIDEMLVSMGRVITGTNIPDTQTK